jgi:predicted patatin/cPLA2 family phospholipase
MRILVLDGGGQLGTFEWGAMCELKRLGIDYKFFDYYIATSAGAFNACFFLAEQFEEGKRIWLEHLPSGFWKPFKNDMAYLQKILTQIEPLDCAAIALRKQKIYVTLANAQNQKDDYVCLDKADSIVDILLAGCSMPFLSGSRKIGSADYYDGGLVAQPPIKKALQYGGAEIWVILTKPAGYRVNGFVWKAVSLFNGKVGKLLYNYPKRQNEIMEMLDGKNNFKIIRPNIPLPIGFRSNNKDKIRDVFGLGQQSVNKFLNAN